MNKIIDKINNIIDWIDYHNEKIYLIFLCISLITMLLANTVLIEESIYNFASNFNMLLRVIRYLTYIIFMILIGTSIWKNKCNRILMCCIFTFGILTYYFSRDFQIFSYMLFVLAAVNVDLKKVTKLYLIIQSLFLIIMIFLSATGLIENIIFDLGVRNRNSLGFSWTTTPAMLLFFVTALYLYCFQDQIKFIELIFLAIINLLVFQLTNSKFIFILSIFLIVIVSVYKYSNYFKCFFQKKICQYLFLSIPFISAFTSLLLQIFYNPKFNIFNALNSLLANRLKYGYDAFWNYGISIFGKKIKWIGFSLNFDGSQIYNYVDSSYMQILLSYGIITFVLVLIAYFYIIKKAISNQDNYLVLILSVVFILSITEPRLINVIYNPFIIFASQFFSKSWKNKCENTICN